MLHLTISLEKDGIPTADDIENLSLLIPVVLKELKVNPQEYYAKNLIIEVEEIKTIYGLNL
jgi:hypothetical protein